MKKKEGDVVPRTIQIIKAVIVGDDQYCVRNLRDNLDSHDNDSAQLKDGIKESNIVDNVVKDPENVGVRRNQRMKIPSTKLVGYNIKY